MEGTLTFKIHTPAFLEEIMGNPGAGALKIPMSVFRRLLCHVAHRSSQLNDPILNRLMCDLTLYDIADPYSEDYNLKKVNKIKSKERTFLKKLNSSGADMTINFMPVKMIGKRKITINGKTKIQQKTFEQTINPFNKNPDGSIRSRQEILVELKKEIAKWQSITTKEQ